MKLCKGKINTNFHKNKIPKEGCECICLSAKLVDLVYKKDYYPQVFLVEWKHVVEEKKKKLLTTSRFPLMFLIKKILIKKNIIKKLDIKLF